jgi:hypothetical protein
MWRVAAGAACWCWSSSFPVLVVPSVSRQIPAKCERRPVSRECECGCRVPVSELGAPADREALAAWALLHGVEVGPDFADRPSVAVKDANRLAADRRVAQAAAEAWVAEQALLQAAVAAAQRRREDIMEEAFGREMRRDVPGGRQRQWPRAQRAALRAAAQFEQGLPVEVRERLGPPRMPVGWESKEK